MTEKKLAQDNLVYHLTIAACIEGMIQNQLMCPHVGGAIAGIMQSVSDTQGNALGEFDEEEFDKEYLNIQRLLNAQLNNKIKFKNE